MVLQNHLSFFKSPAFDPQIIRRYINFIPDNDTLKKGEKYAYKNNCDFFRIYNDFC